MLPNPSWAIGANTSIQIGHVAFVLLVLIHVVKLPKTGIRVWLTMAAPIMLCGAANALIQTDPAENVRIGLAWVFCTSLMTVGVVAAESVDNCVSLLNGVMLGIVLNLAVGVVQCLTMSHGTYPLWSIYPHGDDPAVVVRLVTGMSTPDIFAFRMFGLFDEPSDMTSSIAPWLLAILGLRVLSSGVEPLRKVCASWKALAALLCGFTLMVFSRSGELFVFVPGILAITICSIRGHRGTRMGRREQRLLILIVTSAIIGVAVAGLLERADREVSAKLGEGSSWNERAASLVEALRTWTQTQDLGFVIGRGPAGVTEVLAATHRHVYSIVVKTLLMYGIPMAGCWLILLVTLSNGIRCSRFKLAGGIVMGATVFGMAVVTANQLLMSPWILLGLLARWHVLYPQRVARTELRPFERNGVPHFTFCPPAGDRT